VFQAKSFDVTSKTCSDVQGFIMQADLVNAGFLSNSSRVGLKSSLIYRGLRKAAQPTF
jgi:hypothetical protein